MPRLLHSRRGLLIRLRIPRRLKRPLMLGVGILFAVIVVAVAANGFGTGFLEQSGALTEVDDSRPARTTSGGSAFRLQVPPDQVPGTRDEALSAPALALIPERHAVDPPRATLAPAQRREVAALLDTALADWETVRPEERDGTYAARIAPHAAAGYLDALAMRSDSRDAADVGICAACQTASTPEITPAPSDGMVVRAAGDGWAWVSTQGATMLSGGAYGGQVVRRSYGVVVVEEDDGWRVARIGAETLAIG